MKAKVVELRKYCSSPLTTTEIRGSTRVLASISSNNNTTGLTPRLRRRASSVLRHSERAGVIKKKSVSGKTNNNLKPIEKSVKKEIELAPSAVMKFDSASGTVTLEENKSAWGYLMKIGETNTYVPLDRDITSRSDGERAGYALGSDEKNDIRLNYRNVNENHAFIYCTPRKTSKGVFVAVFLVDRSSFGTWINNKKMPSAGVVELKSGDLLHFGNPIECKEIDKPVFVFYKPDYPTGEQRTIDDVFHCVKNLQEGGFGKVVLGECIATKELYALKYINLDIYNETESKLANTLVREIGVFMSFPVHPCIIQINKVFEMQKEICIVMEYGVGGDLFDVLTKEDQILSEHDVKIVFDQIAHAVAHLHEQGVVHRDVKLENIIMCNQDTLTVKLCDFGLSTFMKRDSPLRTHCGTIVYAAPELIDCERGYGAAVDIWSLGVVLYTALCTSTPFVLLESEDGKELLKEEIRKGECRFDQPVWQTVSDEAKDLIKHMLVTDTKQRYTIEQVLNHPWLQGIQEKDGKGRCESLVKYLERKTKLKLKQLKQLKQQRKQEKLQQKQHQAKNSTTPPLSPKEE